MRALVEDTDDGGGRNLRELTEEIAWFAKGLERDMQREEAELLAPWGLADEYIVTDQEDD